MWQGLLAVAFLAGGSDTAAADATTSIDACVQRLDVTLDVGYTRIAQRCPELTTSLTASPVAAWLPADWDRSNNELSVDGLRQLRALLSEHPRPATVRAPRVARLLPVLAALAPPAQPQSWWERFKAWLRRVFTRAPAPQDAGWLQRFVDELNLSKAWLNGLGWTAFAIVIVLAVGILVHELRLAGLWPRRRARTGDAAAAVPPSTAVLNLQQIQSLPPTEQPRLLLELIIRRLREQERLPPARALTVHELLRVARLTQEPDRARFATLAAASEAVRFAADRLPPERLMDALQRGRELLSALEAPSPVSAGLT
jgi:hypothetical protein